ncbi:MAG: trans-aconitate methyltransferase [Gordonia sp.]|uniref:methyltransferase domain-containing protein n=1 Tax=Gordonia sp. (in: high G+C Gram-positive bacteria) TaxID=84139 RepID=UPI000C558DB0|nr:methyltransferase domain-containing protein [Gordonia sp. (in: high G+C Gram-positive bacteria)]MAU80465.1 trans-aconitate methyltransferase [Gordonia sp. (in: high G+C Gram-positive bacteria)]
MQTWDPDRYLQFADARARPFLDLIAQVPTAPTTIVDLGCGPGHLTRHLRALWPESQILGIDSSPRMIEKAFRENTDPHANYDIADAADWSPNQPVDLIVSNAMFQWLPDPMAVIDRLLGHLNDGGVFAVQVPDNTSSPMHRELRDLADDPRFAEQLRDVRRMPGFDPADLLAFFTERGFTTNTWSTTYLHVLHGDDPVYDWSAGSTARPYLTALDDDDCETFMAEYKQRLRDAYPPQSVGTVLPFQRTFAVATPF